MSSNRVRLAMEASGDRAYPVGELLGVLGWEFRPECAVKPKQRWKERRCVAVAAFGTMARSHPGEGRDNSGDTHAAKGGIHSKTE